MLTCAIVTKHLSFSVVPREYIMSKNTIVFKTNNWAVFACLQSSMHEIWSREYSSTLETRLNYSPTDCFETFPFPCHFERLDSVGSVFYDYRKVVMLAEQQGLTKTYNRFHSPDDREAAMINLRRLHVEMDQAVAAAYNWQDLNLGHSFHETKQGIRYTISESARREVLDRLLTLNHQRNADEEAEAKANPIAAPAKRGRKPRDAGGQIAMDL